MTRSSKLALSAVSLHPSWVERQRTDRPMQKVWLAETRTAKARLQADLERVSEREATLMTELLTDEDLAGRAQLARDLRDGNLPDVDADVPVTPCPEWCEIADHAGEGKNHEGAISAFHLEGYPGESVALGVYLSDDGEPVVSLQADIAMPMKDTDRLMADLGRAKQVAIQIEDGR